MSFSLDPNVKQQHRRLVSTLHNQQGFFFTEKDQKFHQEKLLYALQKKRIQARRQAELERQRSDRRGQWRQALTSLNWRSLSLGFTVLALSTGSVAAWQMSRDGVAVEDIAGAIVFNDEAGNSEPSFQLVALDESALGLSRNPEFLLTAPAYVTAAELQAHLRTSVGVPFEVVDNEEMGNFVVRFTEELAADELVRFELTAFADQGGARLPHEFSWAWQVAPEMQAELLSSSDGDYIFDPTESIRVRFPSSLINHDYQTYFDLTPYVPGSWRREHNELVYTPSEPWPAATAFQLTLEAGLTFSHQDILLSDEPVTFAFASDAREEALIWAHKIFTQTPGGAQYLYARKSGAVTSDPWQMTIWQYDNFVEFQNEVRAWSEVSTDFVAARMHYDIPEADLNEVRMVAELEPRQYEDVLAMPLPVDMPGGFYLVRLQQGDYQYELWLQVSDFQAMTVQSGADVLVWAHDVTSGESVRGAEVVIGDDVFTTDASGLLQTSLVGKTASLARLRAADGRQLLLPLDLAKPVSERAGFLSTDKALYTGQGENMQLWGTVLPAAGAEVAAEEAAPMARLSFGQAGAEVMSRSVSLENGWFTEVVSTADLGPGDYKAELWYEQGRVASVPFTVADEIENRLRVTLESPQTTVRAGEKLRVNVSAQWWDGVPLQNARLTYTSSNLGGGEVVTNEWGEAVIELTPEYNAGRRYPLTEEITVTVAEDPETQATFETLVLGPDIFLDSGWELRQGETVLVVDAYALANVTNQPGWAEAWLADDKSQLNRVSGAEVRGRIIPIGYELVGTGEYFDVTQARFAPKNVFSEQVGELIEFSGRTDSFGRFEYVLPVNPGLKYVVEITSAPDQQNRQDRTQFEIPSILENLDSYGAYLSKYSSSRPTFELDTTLTHRLPEMESTDLGQGSHFLFVDATNAGMTGSVSSLPERVFNYTESDASEHALAAIHFDGRGYQQTKLPAEIKSKSAAARSLEVEIVSQPEAVAWGESGRLELQFPSYSETGGDKAYYRIAVQAVFEPGEEVARSNDDFVIVSSLDPLRLVGDGRVSEVRATSEGGVVETVDVFSGARDWSEVWGIDFTLPDASKLFPGLDPVEWQLVVEVLNTGLTRHGHKVVTVPRRDDFDLEAWLGSTWLSGDTPEILFGVRGEVLREDSLVDFDMKLVDTDWNLQLGNKPGNVRLAEFLPALSAGEYSLEISARAQGYQATEMVDFHVFDALTQQSDVQVANLGSAVPLDFRQQSAGQTYVLPAELAMAYQELVWLSEKLGTGVGHVLAREQSDALLREYFGRELASKNVVIQSSVVDTVASDALGRLIAQKVRGESSLVLDKTDLSWSQMRVQQVLAGQSGSRLVEEALRHETNVALDNLYLGWAMAEDGDYEAAADVLDQAWSVLVKNASNGQSYVEIGSEEENREATVVLMLLASQIHDERAERLYAYVSEVDLSADWQPALSLYWRNWLEQYQKREQTFDFRFMYQGIEQNVHLTKDSFWLKPLSSQFQLTQISLAGLYPEIALMHVGEKDRPAELLDNGLRLAEVNSLGGVKVWQLQGEVDDSSVSRQSALYEIGNLRPLDTSAGIFNDIYVLQYGSVGRLQGLVGEEILGSSKL